MKTDIERAVELLINLRQIRHFPDNDACKIKSAVDGFIKEMKNKKPEQQAKETSE